MPKNSTPATQQYERIVAPCRQSEPVCETWLLSDRESNYLKLRVMSGSTLLYESHDLRVGDLEKMSEDELWSLLEHLSSRRHPSSRGVIKCGDPNLVKSSLDEPDSSSLEKHDGHCDVSCPHQLGTSASHLSLRAKSCCEL